MDKEIRSNEFILVISFLLLLLSFVLVAEYSRSKNRIAFEKIQVQEKIPVTIRGAVRKPGTYFILPGTTLESAIQKSSPRRFADLKKIDLKSRVEESLEIDIEEMKEIVVQVNGAVEREKTLYLPIGTRVNQLKKWIKISENGDKTVFKSRRMLLDGENFNVPQKRD